MTTGTVDGVVATRGRAGGSSISTATPPASADYGKGPDQASIRQITPEDWLLGYMRAGVDCVAVTDHNSGEWIDRVKMALRTLNQRQHNGFRPLYLFPGVEVTANGSIHVLAVFDTDKGSSEVDRLLGDVGYKGDSGASDVAAHEAPIGVVEAICNQGGIPILAHVDGPSGAWSLPGNTLGPLLECDGLSAVEVVDYSSERPDLYRQRRFAWAEVLGSDSHHPTGGAGDRFPGSHFTWVKMAEPTLEGLRLALLDGRGFSIRRSDDSESFDPFALPVHCIEGIEVRDARYMGRGQSARLAFSPWLNALVGGRGTGKSTVLHALRLAARREQALLDLDESSTPRSTFERFHQVPENRMKTGGLKDDTTIQWTVMRDGVRHRVHWRQDGAGPGVEEEAHGTGWVPSSVTPEHLPIRIFGQGEIAELAGENQRALLRVIDEAAAVGGSNEALKEARNAFFAVTGTHSRDGRQVGAPERHRRQAGRRRTQAETLRGCGAYVNPDRIPAPKAAASGGGTTIRCRGSRRSANRRSGGSTAARRLAGGTLRPDLTRRSASCLDNCDVGRRDTGCEPGVAGRCTALARHRRETA